MKVALVIDELNPERGGVEQWTAQFARQLLATGHEVHVVARSFAAALDLPIVPHPVSAGRSRLSFAAAAETALRRLGADVIHDTGSGWHCDVFQPHGGSRTASFKRNMYLVPPMLRPLKRRISPWLPRYREFEALAQRQYADDGRIFLALSRMVARHMVRFHGVRKSALRIVYNGVDVQRFSPEHRWRHRDLVRQRLGLADETILLLIVAHNFRLKGVPSLIRATGQLAREGWRVHLAVAGGKRFGAYRRLAERVGAEDRVTFLGTTADPVPFYAAADIYVQPTWYDPCSLVVLEALASGLPVVTSRFNGAGELMTPGREGFLIDDPGDALELVARLRPLGQRELREQLGSAARRLALEHTLAHNCREIVAVYEEIHRLERRGGMSRCETRRRPVQATSI